MNQKKQPGTHYAPHVGTWRIGKSYMSMMSRGRGPGLTTCKFKSPDWSIHWTVSALRMRILGLSIHIFSQL